VSAYDIRGKPNQGTDSELPTDPQTPHLCQAKGPAMHSGLLLPSPDKSPLQKEVHRIIGVHKKPKLAVAPGFVLWRTKDGKDRI
jgi:hypothetical protein